MTRYAVLMASLLCSVAVANPAPPADPIKHAESLGFSPSVAVRVARRRPDVLASSVAPDPKQTVLLPVNRAYRGFHSITLGEFRPHAAKDAGIFVASGAKDQPPEKSLASGFVYDRAVAAAPGQLRRGFVLQLELPFHFFHGATLEARNAFIKQRLSVGGDFTEILRGEDVPDLGPFIAKIGIADAHGAYRLYPYEELFTPDGRTTPLAAELDAKMAPPPK